MAKHKGKGVQDKGAIEVRRVQAAEPRRVKVAHDKCGDARLDYALFPIGFKYNEDLQSLRMGDIVVFLDGQMSQ